ncbi:MAG: hypothetical protein LBI01_03130 [Elusimicrobium sp.]|jgi:hypothetical protein|nr:hypothetical protein [Elusimicrobium sp.]
MSRSPIIIYEDMTAKYAPSFILPYENQGLAAEFEIEFTEGINSDAVYFSAEGLKKITVFSDANILFEQDNITQTASFGKIKAAGVNNITVAAEAVENNIKINAFKLLRSAVNLGCCAVDFARSDYAKQGYYYLNDGSLLAWKEYQKAGGRMNITNCSFDVKNKILKAFEDNSFLSFQLNPDIDAAALYDFALVKAPAEKFDIKTGLFELELNLAQR